jgi:hypothetical protein
MKKNTTLFLLVLFLSSCNSLIRMVFKTPSHKIGNINFDEPKEKTNFSFIYPDTTNNLPLRQMRVENNLMQLVTNAKSDKERALLILNWTHNQWEHSGSNTPSKSDPLTILSEAKQGKKFRCVEYGIVSSNALLSIGMKARGLGLQAKDVETCKMGAAHYLAEVWLTDLKKWALIDGQFNIMPVLNNIPLNAVEFQRAIIAKQPFLLVNSQGQISEKEKSFYLNFIPHYLFYFNFKFDLRQVSEKERYKVNGKSSLMLVPLNAKAPIVFQRKYANTDYEYTHSLNDFYANPYVLR